MSQIILDMSANTHKNNKDYLKRIMDSIKEIDTGKHEIIFKAQLFQFAPPNMPLDYDVFDFMYDYGKEMGYKVTSSVFDLFSLKFLLEYNPIFIKIANNRSLDYLIDLIPRGLTVYKSMSFSEMCHSYDHKVINLFCVSKYPAKLDDYKKLEICQDVHHCGYLDFTKGKGNVIQLAVSDHTIGLDLFKKYQPAIWEKHYKLHDSTGLDAGEFAITPESLKEIL